MLRVIPTEAAVVACHAEPAALDGFAAREGVFPGRVARDELLLLSCRSRREEVAADARARLSTADPHALVVDQTDGWAVWTVEGPDGEEVLARLMVAKVPSRRPAFLQGAIAGVPAKVVLQDGAAHIMVPSPVGHHLRDRIFEACRELGPDLGPPAPFTVGPG